MSTKHERIQASAMEGEAQDSLIIEANNAKVIAESLNSAVLRALEAVGADLQRIASDQAPVDTGRLAASITHALDPNEPAVYVGTNVEYAGAQELGTSTLTAANGGRGFLRPALEDNKARVQAIFTQELRKAAN